MTQKVIKARAMNKLSYQLFCLLLIIQTNVSACDLEALKKMNLPSSLCDKQIAPSKQLGNNPTYDYQNNQLHKLFKAHPEYKAKYEEIIALKTEAIKKRKAILYFTSLSVPVRSFYLNLGAVGSLMNEFSEIESKQYFIGYKPELQDFLDETKKMIEQTPANVRGIMSNAIGIKIDPRFYKDLNITKVPAYAFADCVGGLSYDNCEIKYVYRGDEMLKSVLKKVSKIDKEYEKYSNFLSGNKKDEK